MVMHIELRGPLLRGRAQTEIQIKEPVERLDVVQVLDQRGPQSVAHHPALSQPRLLQRVQCVQALRRRHPHLVTPQHLHEIVYYSVHELLMRVLVGGAVHLVHRFVRVLAGWFLLAEVFAIGASADVREHFLGVAIVLDDHA